MFLDILAEEGCVGEAEYITDLLDAVVGLLQITLEEITGFLCIQAIREIEDFEGYG